MGKIEQNLEKSFSKGPKNTKILSLKGSIFDFRLGHTCHLANLAPPRDSSFRIRMRDSNFLPIRIFFSNKKQHLQKHYLLWTLRDALGILNNQEDGFNINFEEDLSFTVFYRFMEHKKQFIYQQDIPDTFCLCEICENAALMAKAVRKRKYRDILQTHMT